MSARKEAQHAMKKRNSKEIEEKIEFKEEKFEFKEEKIENIVRIESVVNDTVQRVQSNRIKSIIFIIFIFIINFFFEK